MSKKLKRKEKKLQKLEKARAFNQKFQRADLIKETISPQSGNFLPVSVALNEKFNERFVSGQNFILIFDQYIDKCCQLAQLDRSQARTLIRKFQQITSMSPSELPATNLVRDNIAKSNDGDYSSIYDGLTPDIEVKETELGRGRIFFHLVDRYFCILAIQSKHPNLH